MTGKELAAALSLAKCMIIAERRMSPEGPPLGKFTT